MIKRASKPFLKRAYGGCKPAGRNASKKGKALMKKAIELFSGNADITKALLAAGIDALSDDYDAAKKPDIIADVYDLTPKFLKNFAFIWASPDCTTYSLASHGKHRRKGGVAVSDYAKQCDKNNAALIKKLVELNVPFIIENPRGHFRNMPFAQNLYLCTVYYSQYGMPYSKPTDLLSNRPIAHYFDTRKKLTGLHLDYCKAYGDFLGRCKMPPLLIDDIVKCVKDLIEEK